MDTVPHPDPVLSTLRRAYDNPNVALGQQYPYRVTFGMRFSHEEHPSGMPFHPDTVLTVIAPNGQVARAITHLVCGGNAWGFLYYPDEWPDAREHFREKPTIVVGFNDPEFRTLFEHQENPT